MFLLFFLDYFFFFYFFYFFFSFLFFSFWMGVSFLVESFFNLGLVFLTFLTLLFIFLIEDGFLILLVTFFLFWVSFSFFLVLGVFLFFIFFELSFFPVVFLTLLFGVQVEKMNSVFFLFFYSFFFGYFFLLFFFLDLKVNFLKFLVYFGGFYDSFFLVFWSLVFLMKFPVYFFHFWLPKVHVEASTVASMLLASILLKFGVQGLSRFLLVFISFNNFFFVFLGFISLFFCSLVALIQSDLKSLVAFSSVFHMSVILLAYLSCSLFGKVGGFLMMLSHGFVSFLMFFFVGEIFHNIGTRLVFFGSGFFLSFFFSLIFMSVLFLMNSGLPLSLSFFSEFFIFLGLVSFYFFLFFCFFFVFFFGFYMSLFLILNCYLGMTGSIYWFFYEGSVIFIMLNLNLFFLD
uniref:NADH-ubiquinone oxidoreductase chain 4 n=1 Tax=Globodera ellingtonae TaxID=1517492 RepID=A0A342KCY8_9BILA|nr:NADH dehydrogenase subunit 4 [Globodera ellingtonae]